MLHAETASEGVLCFRDKRVHSWRWQPILEKWGHLRVFLDPDLLKTATFLVEDGSPTSTVFFVGMPLWNPRVPVGFDYFAVTTKHSVENSQVSIRFNLKAGGLEDKETNAADWILHKETDLAILPLRFPLDDFDVKFIEVHEIVKDRGHLMTLEVNEMERVHQHPYGVGDEVFSVGLFSGHYGENIAQPAARFGHIALYPAINEKITAQMGDGTYKPIDAFLIEIAAMQGQSGAPVFLRPWVSPRRDLQRPLGEYNFLVGMIQGFYPMPVDAKIDGKDVEIPVNLGLGVVIPSEVIYDMLMEDSLVKAREERLRKVREEKNRERPQPRTASITQKPADGQGITREDFGEALRRSSRKVTQSDEGEGEA